MSTNLTRHHLVAQLSWLDPQVGARSYSAAAAAAAARAIALEQADSIDLPAGESN